VDHQERADELEREVEKLDEHSEQVGEHIEEAKKEWEAKEDDPSVPGAQPDSNEEETGTGTPDAAGSEE
jgi:hypothetical protein